MTNFYELNFDDVKDIQDGRMRKRIDKAIGFAIRDGLRDIEEHHKKKHFLRGNAKNPKTHPTKITWRTGELAKSYITYWKTGDHFGYYGSTLKRAALLEYGGTVNAKPGKALALPTQAAKTAGFAISPKFWPKGILFRPTLPGGDKAPVLARIGSGGKLEVMFIFMKSVTIKSRPTVKKTAQETGKAFELMMAKRIAKAAEKK